MSLHHFIFVSKAQHVFDTSFWYNKCEVQESIHKEKLIEEKDS